MNHLLTNSNSTRFHHWRSIMASLWINIALTALGLAGFRLALYLSYAPTPLDAPYSEIAQSFFLGLRFDIKQMATWSALILLLSLAFYCLPRIFMVFLNRITKYWLFIGVLLTYLLSLINHFYFAFYQSPINPIIFGFFEDDTNAILESLWSDYPVIWIVLTLLVLCFFQYWLSLQIHKRIFSKLGSWSKLMSVASVLFQFILFVALVRGSLGTFPLRVDTTEISKNSFVNDTVLSGGQALYLAWKDRKSNSIDDNILKGLQAQGFENAQSAAKQLSNLSAEDYFWVKTPVRKSVEKKQPNVVLSIMESWGQHVMAFDQPSRNDMLGNLRPWIKTKADYFNKSLSSQNGTHPSLEAIILDSPITPLTQAYGYKPYSQSIALPYQKAGYRTIFLYAGSLKWRRLNQVLNHQGFDELYGAGAIQSKIPEADFLAWGVQDEYMFQFAQTLFDDNDPRPIFMVTLSSTNHPPYFPPAADTLKPTDINVLGDAPFASTKDIVKKVLKTYQYANSELGKFYDFLERSGHLDHTLFAATGDHNTHSVFIYPGSRSLDMKYGVPILIHIPKAYKESDSAQTKDWSAHQDIMSTLFYYSLSDTKVPRLGRNLYQHSDDAHAFSFIGGGTIITDKGAATNLASPNYYLWDSEHRFLESTNTPDESLLRIVGKNKAWYGLRDWRIRKQINPQ